MVFAFLVDGLVLWTSYQSFLYTALSTPHFKKYPFNDLESFAKSGYMWVSELTPFKNLWNHDDRESR